MDRLVSDRLVSDWISNLVGWVTQQAADQLQLHTQINEDQYMETKRVCSAISTVEHSQCIRTLKRKRTFSE